MKASDNKKFDIACLVDTNTRWKNSHREASLNAAKNRHWRHSHTTTSETDIEWSDIYKPGGTSILTLPPFSSGITNSGSVPHGLGRWSYISIKGRDNNYLTIISAYRVCQNTKKTQDQLQASCNNGNDSRRKPLRIQISAK